MSTENESSQKPESEEKSEDLVYLDPSSIELRWKTDTLEMRKKDEEEWQKAGLIRLFPLTEKERWLSLMDKDGKEIGILKDLRGLSGNSLTALRKELAQRYIIPHIQCILSCRERFDMTEWTVETDRGVRTFLTRGLRDNAKQPLARHFILKDVEDNRYDVPDIMQLDPESRRLLEERL
jgi:hypothetical protein